MPGRKWPEAADLQLRRLWDLAFSLAEIAEALGRSQRAVHHRAQDMGLPTGPPDGYEMLTAACNRTGYHITQLRAILVWAGVEIQMVRAQPSRRATGKGIRCYTGRHFVSPEDVDLAIEDWEIRETATHAADRHGLSPETIRRWLLDARAELGLRHKDVGHLRRLRHWRVSPALLDRIVAHRRQFLHKQTVPPLPPGITEEIT